MINYNVLPESLKNQMDEMERSFPMRTYGYELEAYLQYSSDGPDEWRFRIRDISDPNDPKIVVEHLHPETADAHTYMLMACGFKAAKEIGHKQGLNKAMQSLIRGLTKVIFDPNS